MGKRAKHSGWHPEHPCSINSKANSCRLHASHVITAKIHQLPSTAQITFYENFSSTLTATLQTTLPYSFHSTHDDAVERRCFMNY